MAIGWSFLQGAVIGFAIAAPVGPIGLLCIQRTLKYGIKAGVVSGLGAALADSVYGSIAAFGLVSISTFLLNYEIAIRILGGLILIYLGIKIGLSKAASKAPSDNAKTMRRDFVSVFVLTLTNPATILSFIAIFAGLGIVDKTANYQEAVFIVLGVFSGSLLWWGTLSFVINKIRHRLSSHILQGINRMSSLILILFGVFAIGIGLIFIFT
jgi:threonine/homoserine/homoserine lactone efflux protein